MASAKFVNDFLAVSKHYLCQPDEIEEMKNCARADMENAVICFSALADELNISLYTITYL